jgi:hypothetical protein
MNDHIVALAKHRFRISRTFMQRGVRTRNGNLSTLRSSLPSWNAVRRHIKRMLDLQYKNTKQRLRVPVSS